MSDQKPVERPPKTNLQVLLGVAALIALSLWALPIDLSAISSWAALQASFARLGEYFAAFAAPDLSADMLSRCGNLAMDTVTVALLGTAIGLVLAYPLAIGACRAIVIADGPSSRWAQLFARTILESSRLLLDALRGVPDFMWAILIANLIGPSPITGALAIAVSVAGIFGKVLSEQWDNVNADNYLALKSTGASRLQVFGYGIQPLGARTTMSFVLMRTECAIRNASVIGVVGGGGLGAGLWDEYTDGNWRGVATILLTLLAVTASADLVANLIRRRLRIDPNHPSAAQNLSKEATSRRRKQVLGGVALTLVGCVVWLREPLNQALAELSRIEWDFVRPYTLGLFQPTLDGEVWLAVLRESTVPLAIGVLATVGGGILAALLVYPASIAFQLDSERFTGEHVRPLTRAMRLMTMTAARMIALLLRGVPEVGWLIVLMVFFGSGVTPCIIAVCLHTAGVLHRVFTESLDDVPYQRLERIGAGRLATFGYGALPSAWPSWRTYAFFQFEVNMRIGVALGVVGAGGLGLYFRNNLAYREHSTAAAFLWGMVLLTVAVDRLSRYLQLKRNRC